MFLSRIYYAIAYLIVLIWEIIKATVDMSLRILRAKGIEPVVIDIETDLDSENQFIKVAVIAPRDSKDIIPFEPYIKGMLE